MPWRHQGRRVRITRNIDMGEMGGLVRRGEKGTVTFANRTEGIFEIALDIAHPGLEDNVLAFSPLDAEDPAVERDRLSEAMRFVHSHCAVMTIGGFLVGVTVPVVSPFDIAAHAIPIKTCKRVMEYDGKLFTVTVDIAADGTIESIKSIVPLQEDELPQVK